MGLEETHSYEAHPHCPGILLKRLLPRNAQHALALVGRERDHRHDKDGEQEGLNVLRDGPRVTSGFCDEGLQRRDVDDLGQGVHPVQIDLPEAEDLGTVGPDALDLHLGCIAAKQQVRVVVVVRRHVVRAGVVRVFRIDYLLHGSELERVPAVSWGGGQDRGWGASVLTSS